MKPSSSEAIAAGQLDAYNRQDLDAHCAFFTEDVIVADVGGAVRFQGREAYREQYRRIFTDFPENHARLVHRIVLGGRVIDHEAVSRGPSGPSFEVVAIYSMRDGLIARVDFVKAG